MEVGKNLANKMLKNKHITRGYRAYFFLCFVLNFMLHWETMEILYNLLRFLEIRFIELNLQFVAMAFFSFLLAILFGLKIYTYLAWTRYALRAWGPKQCSLCAVLFFVSCYFQTFHCMFQEEDDTGLKNWGLTHIKVYIFNIWHIFIFFTQK